jgi:hypothetical protein
MKQVFRAPVEATMNECEPISLRSPRGRLADSGLCRVVGMGVGMALTPLLIAIIAIDDVTEIPVLIIVVPFKSNSGERNAARSEATGPRTWSEITWA